MATKHSSQHPTREERPSERAVPVPLPGTEEAALLANLNDVYGNPNPDDEHVLAGIRQSMGDILEHEQ